MIDRSLKTVTKTMTNQIRQRVNDRQGRIDAWAAQ